MGVGVIFWGKGITSGLGLRVLSDNILVSWFDSFAKWGFG